MLEAHLEAVPQEGQKDKTYLSVTDSFRHSR